MRGAASIQMLADQRAVAHFTTNAPGRQFSAAFFGLRQVIDVAILVGRSGSLAHICKPMCAGSSGVVQIEVCQKQKAKNASSRASSERIGGGACQPSAFIPVAACTHISAR